MFLSLFILHLLGWDNKWFYSLFLIMFPLLVSNDDLMMILEAGYVCTVACIKKFHEIFHFTALRIFYLQIKMLTNRRKGTSVSAVACFQVLFLQPLRKQHELYCCGNFCMWISIYQAKRHRLKRLETEKQITTVFTKTSSISYNLQMTTGIKEEEKTEAAQGRERLHT